MQPNLTLDVRPNSFSTCQKPRFSPPTPKTEPRPLRIARSSLEQDGQHPRDRPRSASGSVDRGHLRDLQQVSSKGRRKDASVQRMQARRVRAGLVLRDLRSCRPYLSSQLLQVSCEAYNFDLHTNCTSLFPALSARRKPGRCTARSASERSCLGFSFCSRRRKLWAPS